MLVKGRIALGISSSAIFLGVPGTMVLLWDGTGDALQGRGQDVRATDHSMAGIGRVVMGKG